MNLSDKNKYKMKEICQATKLLIKIQINYQDNKAS